MHTTYKVEHLEDILGPNPEKQIEIGGLILVVPDYMKK